MNLTEVRLKALLPAIAWTLLIIILLSIPGRYVPSRALWSYDKVGHVILFLGLAFFWMRAFEAHSMRVVLPILIAGLLFAPLTELYQGILGAGRRADVMDSLADIVGFSLGTLAWILVDRASNRVAPEDPA